MKSFYSLIAVFAAVLLSESNVASLNFKERQRNRAVKRLSEAIKNTELKDATKSKIESGKRLNRLERREIKTVERNVYLAKRAQGQDEVSNTAEAAALRAYKLRSKKRKGLLRKREASIAEVLFPGVAPEQYMPGERVFIYADLVDSRKTPIPYEYYDLPTCEMPEETDFGKKRRERRNLGSRLQGHFLKVAPFTNIRVKSNIGCTPLCTVNFDSKKMRWMRRLVERQYRVQLTLDQLPVLMRSKEYNYAVRGYPLGFQAPPSFKALKSGEFYLFNHLKFVITYHEDPSSFTGVRVTGFDVHPMSVNHELPNDGSAVSEQSKLNTCSGGAVDNDPENYVPLRMKGPTALPVTYSYEVEWAESDLQWADRWDVYLVGAPDDDLHYFSIVNSLMIVLFLTGAISTIMVRTLRKDIAVYNEMDSLDDSAEETGWKLVHGDVFRPPTTAPMMLSVLTGTGCQLGLAFCIAMMAAMAKFLNPVKKGHTLTAMIVLYVLCGSVAGYVSSRIYKFTDGKAWKLNVIATAVGLPGSMVCLFTVLNVFLSFAGAATAVSFLTIICLFLLWVCVSAPLVFIGAYFGLKAEKIECPVKTNQIARVVPPLPCYAEPKFTFIMGGLLPFGSVCIELAFIMSALWLHQIYYVMGFLLAVLLILTATCAQVSVVLTYLQLCAENHRWWWWSFWNCGSAGIYLFAYAIWFLGSRLEMVGFLPVIVYLTYMGMMSICFGMYCGAVGFLSSFWFVRTIYGAVKVD
uniref:Transmembrane 9 superfamily member n=1 Tax=Entomoneis paludosa TaxID=265537 RepID=A0A7S3DNG9_9STRA|mmetsp:Transcript_23573/g.48930  ORF Transcript_23573/g.48930 Transcript_23573/m.48930 type:complete len:747 (+) Transcript_23573:210-2450(+)